MRKNDLVSNLFRNSDHEEPIPELQSEPEVKKEPEHLDSTNLSRKIDGGNNASVKNGSEKQAQFVQVENREVFDYEPNANSIHASMWPHWWLKAVNSRYKLRKEEARKNDKFKKGLRELMQEALQVGTIFCFRKSGTFIKQNMGVGFNEAKANELPLELL